MLVQVFLRDNRAVVILPIMRFREASLPLLLILLALVPLAPSGALAQNDKNDNAGHYMEIADQVFSEAGVEVPSEVESALSRAIERRVESPHTESTRTAESNVRNFARSLVDASRQNTTGRKQITLRQLNSALGSVCPLYPIC
jgi:hypothetical protein